MKQYLEKTFYSATTVICFNEKNLSAIEIFRGTDLNILHFDDINDLNDAYNLYIGTYFKLSDKKTFDSAYIEFTKNLNELAKEI